MTASARCSSCGRYEHTRTRGTRGVGERAGRHQGGMAIALHTSLAPALRAVARLTFSKWLVLHHRLVHHDNTAMTLSTTAPETEYASRRGSLTASINLAKSVGVMRASSSRGKLVESLATSVSDELAGSGDEDTPPHQARHALANVSQGIVPLDAYNLLWEVAPDRAGRRLAVVRV